MKTRLLIVIITVLFLSGWLLRRWRTSVYDREDVHYEHGETEVVVSNLTGSSVELARTASSLYDSTSTMTFSGRAWLPAGNYFLRTRQSRTSVCVPVPLTGFRCGPDEDGTFMVTLRTIPEEFPPRWQHDGPVFAFIASGSFLLGDRLNPREPHYVWLTGYFISPFEVTNGEYRMFLKDSSGYQEDGNWCEAGREWKHSHTSQSSAAHALIDNNDRRFCQNDQPVTWVTWFEANAYCHWLTRTSGRNRWLFTLPSDAEWEKAARGPDNFDYGLTRAISDSEVSLYNWKKNPYTPITVVGIRESQQHFKPNRYGLFHMSGNVAEWTQSVNKPYNRENRYEDDERNFDDTPGLRSVRGGSWYSAATSYLYIPYRDAFQREHSSQELGFRIVARALP